MKSDSSSLITVYVVLLKKNKKNNGYPKFAAQAESWPRCKYDSTNIKEAVRRDNFCKLKVTLLFEWNRETL